MEGTWLIVIGGGLGILVLLFCFFWYWLGSLLKRSQENQMKQLMILNEQLEQLVNMYHDEVLIKALRTDLNPDDFDDKKYIDTIASSILSETGVWTFGVNLEKRGYVNYERPGNIKESTERTEE